MAILTKPRILPQQRLDLEDWNALLFGMEADSKFWIKSLFAPTSYVVKGFSVTGLGAPSPVAIPLDGSTLLNADNSGGFSWFVGDVGASPLLATLQPSARNYIELELSRVDATPLTRAFWDPSAQGGLGSEFTQTTNTMTNLQVTPVVLQGGFSGNPNRVKLAVVDTDSGNNVTAILDKRELFFRLGTAADPKANYSWGSQLEPAITLTLSGTSGTFTAGETITFSGGATAVVQTGGTSSIAVILPSSDSFAAGNTVTGGSSGATGTLVTASASFSGADKSIDTFRELLASIQTEIKKMKGTDFWFETGYGSISGLNSFVNSAIAPFTSTAVIKWDGTNVYITDANVAPTGSDIVAKIRVFRTNQQFNLARQDDGKEIQIANFSAVPDAGTFTLDHNGDVSDPINWDDAAADVLTALNAQWTAQVESVTGNFEKGFTIKFAVAGAVPQFTVGSNSLTLFGNAVSITPGTLKNGTTSTQVVPVADGQVLYVELPASGNRTFSAPGSGATNYRVAALGSFVNNDSNYWLAYREGGRLIWRGIGELGIGEESQIGDNVPQTLLDIIGIATEATPPTYSSNVRGIQSEDLVSRIGKLTDAAGDEQENRSGYLRSDELVTWTGAALEWTEPMVLEFINTKNGTITQHEIDPSQSPFSLANLESAWVEINRSDASETVVLKKSTVDAVPPQSQGDKDVFVLFRRKDALGNAFLHIPFHKQVLNPGQSVRLGASGSGSGSIQKVDLHDATSTTLPTGPTVNIDGVAGVNGDRVLFSNLSSNNNRVYELSGVGVSIAWTPLNYFNNLPDPSRGDMIVVVDGTDFGDQVGKFGAADWEFNAIVRYFEGANFWEESGLRSKAIANNQSSADDFLVGDQDEYENVIITYSLIRGTNKEIGQIYITHNGTTVSTVVTGTTVGAPGVTFAAILDAGNLEVSYTSDNSGPTGTLKYSVKRWRD